ncbi:MAG: hypothetical protein N5P05_001241 [Chroococcopsis gigantea SAG 12.99]|jgi:energy-coupling factor transporter ATP-binding protein EcfA2|nr:AAA family ATPase [Chlorogloea purpurea SAG 13.99]MDV2999635.1 hypothetical protein [Chroococcopsis gigantea SAG 12.99]
MLYLYGQRLNLYEQEYGELLRAIEDGRSVSVIGEAGAGKSTLIARVLDGVTGYSKIVESTYIGSAKQTLVSIAEQLNITTVNDKNKPLNIDELKEEIARGVDRSTLLICDNAHRWPASLRYWLEILHDRGAVLILPSIEDLKKDIFVRVSKIKMTPPNQAQMRELMIHIAVAEGYDLSPSKLAYLQSIAGSNPGLAKKVIQEAKIGMHFREVEHNLYVNIAPFLSAALVLFGVVRFLGLGMGDQALYIFGGIMMLIGIAVRYIGIGLNQSQRRKPLGKK